MVDSGLRSSKVIRNGKKWTMTKAEGFEDDAESPKLMCHVMWHNLTVPSKINHI